MKETKSGGPPLIETRSLEVGNCSEKSLNSDDDEKDNNNNNNDDNKTSPPLIDAQSAKSSQAGKRCPERPIQRFPKQQQVLEQQKKIPS